MVIVDWPGVLMGFAAGMAASILYFAGLAFSVQVALTSPRAAAVLVSSAVLRIGLLLAVGWLVTGGATLVWAFVGYGLAFFLVRSLATIYATPHARVPRPKDVR